MKIAFQMDPMDSLNFASDSTWQLMLEAAKKGSIYHYLPKNLSWNNGELLAEIQEVQIVNGDYKLSEAKTINLAEMDIIFIRQDPPYDMAYLTTTYLLEKISDKVLILNDPKAIRDFPEKISILDYVSLIPHTLITYSENEAKNFAKNYDNVILKPLYSFAGNDVFCVKRDDINFSNIMDDLIKVYKAPVIVQKFIENVSQGDKRIILVDGDPVGGVLRVPKAGDIRANLVRGGKAFKAELTAREIEICEAIKPKLIKNGLFLVGIDVIDGFLTEINVTSPTGLVMIKEFYNHNIAQEIIEKAVIKYNKLTNS